MQMSPSSRQPSAVRRTACRTRSTLPRAQALEMAGRSMTDRELLKTAGNMMVEKDHTGEDPVDA